MLKYVSSIQPSMRILHLGEYEKPITGGIGRSIVLLVDAMAKDHDVMIISLRKGEETQVMHSGKASALPFKSPLHKKLAPLRSLIPSIITSHLTNHKKIIDEIKRFNPDIIHAHRPFYAQLISSLPYPKVFSVHALFDQENSTGPLKYHLAQRIHRMHFFKTLRTFPAFITISDSVTAYVKTFHPKMLFQIYSPVKEEFYLPTRKSEPGRILSIGRLVEQKFPLEFFEEFSKAARQNKKLHLHILGVIEDKAYYKTVKSFLASHDLTGRITFHENLDDQEVAAHLERCEMLVHPSVHETFGLVIAEAMAAGVPVIVRRCGGVSNLITHRKQGLSCNTAGEVGKAISLLHGNKSLQESLGKSARAFAERWRETFVVKETILAYKKIIAEQKSTGILS